MNFKVKVREATEVLRSKLGWNDLQDKPKLSFVLGSGLGAFAESLTDRREVSFSEVPYIPVSTVSGHAGKFVVGKTETGTTVLVQQGRIHYYEGHDLPTVTLPIRLHRELGVEHLVLTTSTGSVNESYHPGEFMLIKDQLNLAQLSPMRGLSEEEIGSSRFVDMTEPFDLAVNQSLLEVAKAERSDIILHEGVFGLAVGSQYETPAEIRMLRTLGADVVSMSTVPETIVARQVGLKVNGVANITNYGSGMGHAKLDHGHVAEAAGKASEKFIWLLNRLASFY